MKVDQTQTHHYDGELKHTELFVNVKDFLSNVTNSEKKDTVTNFVHDILLFNVEEKDNTSVNYLNSIMNQWGNSSNYDVANDMCAEDMLYVCALEFNKMRELYVKDGGRNEFVPNSSESLPQAGGTMIQNEFLVPFCKEMFIQLSDVQCGPCPQGRVIRLWQVIVAYYEWFK
jgi:hypothetical protein